MRPLRKLYYLLMTEEIQATKGRLAHAAFTIVLDEFGRTASRVAG